MSFLKKAGDLVYTFRFIRMLVLKWPEWDAYKLGIIDKDGKRIKSTKIDGDEMRSAWTPFIRLCANIKRLISKIPGGGSRLGGFVSALYLIKESVDINDLDFLSEENQWFMKEDGTISPGVYQVEEYKLLNNTFEEMVYPKDKVRIKEDSKPVGQLFGIDVYLATHLRTNQPVYVTNREIYR